MGYLIGIDRADPLTEWTGVLDTAEGGCATRFLSNPRQTLPIHAKTARGRGPLGRAWDAVGYLGGGSGGLGSPKSPKLGSHGMNREDRASHLVIGEKEPSGDCVTRAEGWASPGLDPSLPAFSHPVKPNPGSPGAPVYRRSFRMTN